MTKRFFICTDERFPRESAGANYIQYFAKTLADIGYEPIVLAYTDRIEAEAGIEKVYSGIKYVLVKCPERKVQHFLAFHFALGKYYLPILRRYQICDQDILWLYSAEKPLVDIICKFARGNHIRLGACVVEWFTAYRHRNLKECWMYLRYKYVYARKFTRIKYLLPISFWLDTYYKRFGCHTMVLPIMIDVEEYQWHSEQKSGDIVRIIYPGGKSNKDNLNLVLQSLLEIEDEPPYEMHFTGISKEELQAAVSLTAKELSQLESHLVLHGWMPYEELIALYQKMDFMVLFREENKTNLANFPSKIPETMCYGIIPIVSKVGDYGHLYLKQGENALLVEQNALQSCTEVLRKAICMQETEKELLRKNARKTAENVFDYHNFEHKLQEFLKEM